MNVESSYLQFLPPFLGSQEVDPLRFLSRFLCIFERILTGLPQDPKAPPLVRADGRVDPTVEAIIDTIPELFDPWRAPVWFLPRLASGLGLEVQPDWDEPRLRRLIEGAVGFFKQRWRKQGLYAFLNLYATQGLAARVAIDDGEAVLRGRFTTEAGIDYLDLRPAAYARPGPRTIPSQPASPTNDLNRTGAALIHPISLAVGGTADAPEYVVLDQGPLDLPNNARRPALWRISPGGQFLDWGASAPLSLNANDPAPPLTNPVAVVAEGPGSYLVLDSFKLVPPSPGILYRYKTGQPRQTVITDTKLGALNPVDMARDAQGRLFVLAAGPQAADSTFKPVLIKVTFDSQGNATPVPIALDPVVKNPTCLALVSDRNGLAALIGDARGQSVSPGQPVPYPSAVLQALVGDVVRVRPDATGTPAPESLLGGLAPSDNPLIYPTGLAGLDGGSYLVCDRGFKDNPWRPLTSTIGDDPILVMAGPATVYRLSPGSPPQLGVVQLGATLVVPQKLVWDGPRLLVLERGGFTFDSATRFDYRAEPYRVGVQVDFDARRVLPTDLTQLQAARNACYQTFLVLANILERERPAHVNWGFQFVMQGGGRSPQSLFGARESVRPAGNVHNGA